MNLEYSITSKSRAIIASLAPENPISVALDARLTSHPHVIDFRRSAREDSILLESPAPSGSIVRVVRLSERIVKVVATPACSALLPEVRRELRRSLAARTLFVGEHWLRRRPHIDVSRLILEAAPLKVSPLDWVTLLDFLMDQGGHATLIDCASRMSRSDDPVSAVLAIAAAKAISIDIARPLGPLTCVSLARAL